MVGNGMRAVIVGELCVRNQFGPGCGVIAAENTEVGFNFLVDLFCFAVGLRMVGGGEGKVVM